MHSVVVPSPDSNGSTPPALDAAGGRHDAPAVLGANTVNGPTTSTQRRMSFKLQRAGTELVAIALAPPRFAAAAARKLWGAWSAWKTHKQGVDKRAARRQSHDVASGAVAAVDAQTPTMADDRSGGAEGVDVLTADDAVAAIDSTEKADDDSTADNAAGAATALATTAGEEVAVKDAALAPREYTQSPPKGRNVPLSRPPHYPSGSSDDDRVDTSTGSGNECGRGGSAAASAVVDLEDGGSTDRGHSDSQHRLQMQIMMPFTQRPGGPGSKALRDSSDSGGAIPTTMTATENAGMDDDVGSDGGGPLVVPLTQAPVRQLSTPAATMGRTPRSAEVVKALVKLQQVLPSVRYFASLSVLSTQQHAVAVTTPQQQQRDRQPVAAGGMDMSNSVGVTPSAATVVSPVGNGGDGGLHHDYRNDGVTAEAGLSASVGATPLLTSPPGCDSTGHSAAAAAHGGPVEQQQPPPSASVGVSPSQGGADDDVLATAAAASGQQQQLPLLPMLEPSTQEGDDPVGVRVAPVTVPIRGKYSRVGAGMDATNILVKEGGGRGRGHRASSVDADAPVAAAAAAAATETAMSSGSGSAAQPPEPRRSSRARNGPAL